MPIHNAEVGEVFNEYAGLLEIEGANEFRVRAYRTAARNIADFPRSISDMVQQKENLSGLPGLGKDLAGKVAEIVNTGKLTQLEELKKKLPVELIAISKLAGLGPKKTGIIYQKLGITSIEGLEEAASAKRIRDLPGFGAKTEQKILEEIGRKAKSGGEKRYKLSVAMELAQPLMEYLKNTKGVKKVEAAGSYRRKKETIGDLDILVTHKKGAQVMERFVEYEDVERIISKGEKRSSVVLRFGMQVDLRAFTESSYGAALHYFTGSQAHNIAVRKIGVKKNLKINEYGVFKEKNKIAGRSEDEVYSTVELPYIEPELRENNGEIEAAKKGNLPDLVTLENIKGDFHIHTKTTDGRSTLEEMARAAKDSAYEYIAITEHSKHVSVAKGLDRKRLAEQIDTIDRLNEKLDGITVLKGIELDILEDGSLDLPNDILRKLDLVVCAVHYKFNLSAEKQTERILRGIDNPYFTILAHPTGRMIGEREPYPLKMEKIMKAARDTGTVLELNAQPARLDLTDVHAKMTKENGVMVAISTDAHSVNEMQFMQFGVYQARRGWLEAEGVLNTRRWKDLKKILKKR